MKMQVADKYKVLMGHIQGTDMKDYYDEIPAEKLGYDNISIKKKAEFLVKKGLASPIVKKKRVEDSGVKKLDLKAEEKKAEAKKGVNSATP